MQTGVPGIEPFSTIRGYVILRPSLTSTTWHEVFDMDLASTSASTHTARFGNRQMCPSHGPIHEPVCLPTFPFQQGIGVRTSAAASTSPRRQSSGTTQAANQRNRWTIHHFCSLTGTLPRQARSVRTSVPLPCRVFDRCTTWPWPPASHTQTFRTWNKKTAKACRHALSPI